MTCSFQLIEENLHAALSVFARAKLRLPGLLLVSSGVRFATFNAALLTAPVASAGELEGRLRAASAWFQDRGLPWSVWLCEDWLAGRLQRAAPRILAEAGLHLMTRMPGMAAEGIRPPLRPLPPLVCRRVADETTRFAFDHIMSVAFNVPFDVSRQIYGAEQTWGGGMSGYLGLLDGNPVSTAATVVAGGAVGLYAVATLPGFQGKGYAEAVVRHALAASGIERCVLEATSAGVALYARLGFKPVTRYSVSVTGYTTSKFMA
ncbi:MAG: GNAT family N-acetyltransferase [Acidobacteriota bacterium]